MALDYEELYGLSIGKIKKLLDEKEKAEADLKRVSESLGRAAGVIGAAQDVCRYPYMPALELANLISKLRVAGKEYDAKADRGN